MPVKKAAKKAYKRSVKLRDVNALHRTAMKKAVKELKKAVVASSDDVKTLAVKAQSLVAKAKKNNIVHKNTAARKQSQIAKMANKSATK
jgi:small subunit ribosomal protein S20